jgi:molecular chaperone GrpE
LEHKKNNEAHQHKENEHKKEEEKKVEVKVEEKDKEKLEKELIEKENIIKELNDRYLRALAELDNYKKRAAKEKEEQIKYAIVETIGEILPVLDNLEKAIKASEGVNDVKSLKEGIELILKQFYGIFAKIGVKEVETKGIANPDFHHIIEKQVVNDKEEGEILEVYQKGFLFYDKLIRPALIKIAIKENQEKAVENNEKDDKENLGNNNDKK